MTSRLARWTVHCASLLVPRGRREEWVEEWMAELDVLVQRRGDERALGRAPSQLGFALGAIPHAVWLRMDGWTVDSIFQDLRYAARTLARTPGFTLVAAVTLALGIGANGSVFSLVNGLMFRAPAGVEDPERLIQIARSYETDPRWDNFSWPALKLIEAEARALDGVAAYEGNGFVLGRGEDTEQVVGQYVTGNFFTVLGVRPALGRTLFVSDDVEPGAHPVVVVSYELWSRRFGADPGLVGRTIPIGSRPYEVVGIAPEGFAGVSALGSQPQLWVPMMQLPPRFGGLPFDNWGFSAFNVFGRLADGVSFEQAEASMDVLAARLREATPENRDMLVLVAEGIGLDPAERLEAGRVSAILMLIVGALLLLTCTNVANLFLARATGRRAEVGVRMALGAGRGRVIRQLVTESVLLGLVATVLALPVVLVAGRFVPAVVPYALSVSVGADEKVFLFLITVGVFAGLVFGAVPAFATTGRYVSSALREGNSTGGRRTSRVRDALVVCQLGLSLALVTGAALLGRSVSNARAADPGFEVDDLSAGVVWLEPTGRYDREQGLDLYERVLDATETVPGVMSVTMANQMPIAGGHARSTVRPEGREEVEFEAEYIVVADRYFETLGIPLRAGRVLGGLADEPEPVVVVNETLAAMFWPGENAVGKSLAGDPLMRVVGVVGDVQMRSLRSRARPAVYYPLGQRYSDRMAIHVRGAPGVGVSQEQLQTAIAGLDPELPLPVFTSLREALAVSMGETRTIGLMVGAFAGLALAMAAVGLYGLVAYAASMRVKEMGIRIALGAEPRSLIRLVIGRGLGLSLVGVAVGLVVSFGLATALRGLLFGVGAADLPSFMGAAFALLVTTAVAAWIPARRASRLDAATSLRVGE